MAGTKPLLFIYPLTPSLQKLKEVIEKTAEEDGVEIYEIDNVSEAAQLIPTVGQSLTLCGNPKKCAQVLQATKKPIKKLNSKVILLSAKPIKRATLDKFSKVGLTECINEPVPPKTLLYKVNLILRSIKGVSESDDEEQEIKSLGGKDEEEESSSEKRRMERGVIEEDDAEDMYGTKKKKKRDQVEIEEEEKENKKSNYQEDAIGTHWSGKNKKKEALEGEEEEDSKKLANDDDNYDSYYKGKQSKDLSIEEEEEEAKKTKREDIDEDLYETAELKKSHELELEEEERKKKKDEEDESDAYMKGKVSENLDLEVDDQEHTQERDEEDEDDFLRGKVNKKLDIEEEDEDFVDKEEVEEQEYEEDEEEKKKSLELIDDEEKKKHNLEEDEYEEEDAPEIEKDLEFEGEELEGPEKDEEEELEDKDRREKEEAEKIEKYYKGELSNEEDPEEDDEDENGIKKEKLEFSDFEDESGKEKREDLEEDDSDYDDKKEKKEELELELDEDEKDRNNGEDEEGEFGHGKGEKQLDLEDEDKNKDYEDDEHLDHDGDFGRRKSENTNLDLEGDDKDKDFGAEDDDLGDFQRRKIDKGLDVEDDGFKKKAKLIEKNIDTHYSNKKSVKHEDYDWDIEQERKKKGYEEEKKKRQADIEMTLGEKKDWGEQTINYAKLWDEFGGITTEREGNLDKKTGPKYYSEDETKELGKGVYGPDGELLRDEFGNLIEDEDEEGSNKLFEPEANGLDTAIQVLNRYYDKDTKIEEILSYISERLYKEEGALTAFIATDPKTNEYKDLHIGHLSLEKDIEEKDREEAWKKLRKSNLAKWRGLLLPNWSDLTFQAKEIEFYYPFYEGVNDMGMAIVNFKNGFSEEKCKKIEIILETARGLYLETYHEAGEKGSYTKGSKVDKAKSAVGKIKGFFGRLLGKKAS